MWDPFIRGLVLELPVKQQAPLYLTMPKQCTKLPIA